MSQVIANVELNNGFYAKNLMYKNRNIMFCFFYTGDYK